MHLLAHSFRQIGLAQPYSPRCPPVRVLRQAVFGAFVAKGKERRLTAQCPVKIHGAEPLAAASKSGLSSRHGKAIHQTRATRGLERLQAAAPGEVRGVPGLGWGLLVQAHAVVVAHQGRA